MIQRSDPQEKVMEISDPREPRVSPPGKMTSTDNERPSLGVLAAYGSNSVVREALQ